MKNLVCLSDSYKGKVEIKASNSTPTLPFITPPPVGSFELSGLKGFTSSYPWIFRFMN
jgi:hypothetical protein